MLFWDVINENIYENAMVRLPSVPFYRTLLSLRSVPGPVVKPLIIFPKKIQRFYNFYHLSVFDAGFYMNSF